MRVRDSRASSPPCGVRLAESAASKFWKHRLERIIQICLVLKISHVEWSGGATDVINIASVVQCLFSELINVYYLPGDVCQAQQLSRYVPFCVA